MNRRLSLGSLALCLTALLVAGQSGMGADAARQLVTKGNQAYEKGEFGQALAYYDEASVAMPESAEIRFNRGAAYYGQEDYVKAAGEFEQAALRSKEPELMSRANFNLGNCAFRQAQRQRDSDLAKAIEHCRKSITHYQEARDLDPECRDAAENIEIVRLFVKVLLDEQKQQQEQQQQQQQQGGGDQDQEQQEQQDEAQQQDGKNDQQQDQQQQQGEQKQEEGQDGQDESERQREAAEMRQESADDILDEEKKNQEERAPVRPGRVRPVDRDW